MRIPENFLLRRLYVSLLPVLLAGLLPAIALAADSDEPYGGEIVRAVVAFEQIGASATPSGQSFSFDFFISRPLPFEGKKPSDEPDQFWGPRARWWGDVNVSSYPYTQKTSLATFAQQFTSTFGQQNINTLAQSINFTTGPEVWLARGQTHRHSLTDSSAWTRMALAWFAGVGATGPNNPADNATVFQSPVQGSAQDTLLRGNLGLAPCAAGSSTPCAGYTPCPAPAAGATPSACTNYIALVPRSGDRFLQQWGTGLRLYSVFTKPDGKTPYYTSPATVEFSIGQDASVTRDHLHNFVGHAAAMYPFSIGARGASDTVVIYLFGEVTTALVHNKLQNTVILSPALDSSGNPIAVNAAGVTQIPVDANQRDTYRIGVGIDLMTVWKKLNNSSGTPPKS